MDETYVTKVEHELLKKEFVQLDKNTAVEIAKLGTRVRGVEDDVGEIKDDIKDIRKDSKDIKNMVIGIAASALLTLIGMVVSLLM